MVGTPAISIRSRDSTPAAVSCRDTSSKLTSSTAPGGSAAGGAQSAAGPVRAGRLVRRINLAPELRAVAGKSGGRRLRDHPLFRGLRRELREEVVLPPGATASYLGAINDDGNPVGRVHFGLAFLLSVPALPEMARRRRSGRLAPRLLARRRRRRRGLGRVRLRREPGSVQVGTLLDLEQIAAYRGAMETWSALLLDSGLLAAGAAVAAGAAASPGDGP